MNVQSSPLLAMGAASLEALQRQFRAAPGSIDPSWRLVFEVLEEMELPEGRDSIEEAVRAALHAEAIRARGHLDAATDPLAEPHPPLAEEATPLAALERAYRGSLTVETAHMDDPAASAWLRERFEAGQAAPDAGTRRAMLRGLLAADEFERFLGVKFPTKKRFGAEGAEALIPLLRRLLEQAALAGVTQVVMGTMHRGRLSILANVLGKPAARIIAEIKGLHPFADQPGRAGDVPYHFGLDTVLDIGGRPLRVSLLANPSHLEAVDALVLGKARALQDVEGEGGRARVLPLILHTDAAVIGQGVVAEALQLGGTAGFGTGGAVHVVVNNRIGFTTEEADARTSRHCTGAWKATDSAILHVNGEDPDAVARAADFALGYRGSQGRDAVIDLVCFRRNGHNEIDEPGFTQPLLYRRIASREPLAAAYGRRLVAEGVIGEAEVEAERMRCRDSLAGAYEQAAQASGPAQPPMRPMPPPEPETGLPAETLAALAARLAEPPPGLAAHPRLGRVLRQRLPSADGLVTWPVAESLAFGSLLVEGMPIRLSGQDVIRGAFSQRHFGLFDGETGAMHLALNQLGADQARFSVHNSPLSEYAVLGFEYGYSLGRPDALTLWEAQFGDFANGAQIVIDQFVMAAEEKWCDRSGLVLLLPHGLEGQGPEHSSARPERFLQMAAKDNVRIANPSTPANYFHLLRRQARLIDRRPLIVMSPKKLLRLPAAVSPLSDVAPGQRFAPVLASACEGHVRLVLLCSGKIAYELEAEAARQAGGVAVVRVEQLYPFPEEALAALCRAWPDAAFRWVQEEPENMGAWNWIERRLERLLIRAGIRAPRPAYVGRQESPSPAGGFHDDHDRDQARIVAEALALPPMQRKRRG